MKQEEIDKAIERIEKDKPVIGWDRVYEIHRGVEKQLAEKHPDCSFCNPTGLKKTRDSGQEVVEV